MDARLSIERSSRGVERERRRERRLNVRQLRCWLPHPASIVNVSPSGLAIETTRRFHHKESIFLTATVLARTFRIPGRVRWCREVRRSGSGLQRVFRVGLAVVRSPRSSDWLSLLRAGSDAA